MTLNGWFTEGYKRELIGQKYRLITLIAFLLSVYQIWSVIFSTLHPMNQMSLHLSFILMLTYLIYGYSKKTVLRNGPTVMDYIFVCLAFASGLYYAIHAERIVNRVSIMDPLTNSDIFFGLILVILSIEAVRRTIGFPIVVVVLVFLSYLLWGHQFTGILYHREFPPIEILEELAFSFNGLWGNPMAVAATFVFMFLLFGAFLQKSGAGNFFFDISSAIAGRTRGGAAKIAVLASAFFGSITGSPVANVATTGPFTIPMAKRIGYQSRFAGAVEAAASTGGSFLPPIMGSAAFLMVAVTQMSYTSIIVAALIPGILYYVALMGMVHFEALRKNLPKASDESIPKVKKVLKEGWYYFIPLVILVVFLVNGYSPSLTAFYGILAVIVVSWFRKSTRMGPRKIYEAMADGAKTAIPVTTACAAAGLVIAGIMTTGLGGKLTSIVLGFTQGMLFPTLLLVMVICIILGMGMPVAAAYVLTAMLAAPALIELGVPTLTAHLFIVYFSIISAITPPVAVAAFAAAGIAKASPNMVGFGALRLAIAGLVVPFVFVFEPALLMEGSPGEILLASVTAVIGILTIAAGLIGWLIKPANILERLILVPSGLMIIFPGFTTDFMGILLIAFVYILQRSRKDIPSLRITKQETPIK
ncbi:TRAP transporter permease [Salicibibacter cibarius]|uniref:TRAP transporter permease n=2 Tax=Salicibibacter cibarius TaxID=2743000 RepID=A0A7T6Z0K8_9BACI|nr:TRAP transporter permease [Salicibibacter cibarius]